MPIVLDEEIFDDLAEFLNEVADADPGAIFALIESRVPCCQQLADHPTVQVSDRSGAPMVGFLGLLNGWLGRHGLRLVAEVDLQAETAEAFTLERISSKPEASRP